jgi:hypothetical protein
MISKLFKPAWQHKHPERRIAAIQSFSESDQSHQDILVAIVRILLAIAQMLKFDPLHWVKLKMKNR